MDTANSEISGPEISRQALEEAMERHEVKISAHNSLGLTAPQHKIYMKLKHNGVERAEAIAEARKS